MHTDSSPYICITSDTHAGASLDTYGEYLESRYREEFKAWRGAYRNPAKKHIGGKKLKNWDSGLRNRELLADGVVGEVIFPNTVPPFYERAFHVAPPPTPEAVRARAGSPARARTTAGSRSSAAEEPERRAGIGLIHLNDVDEAIERRAVDRGTRAARRRAAAAALAVRHPLAEEAERSALRPAVGRDPGLTTW